MQTFILYIYIYITVLCHVQLFLSLCACMDGFWDTEFHFDSTGSSIIMLTNPTQLELELETVCSVVGDLLEFGSKQTHL